MLSVGPEELAVFGGLLLFLLIFGPGKFSSTARDLGQLLSGTKRTVEEAKSDLIPEKVKETRDAIKGPQERSAIRPTAGQRAPQTLAPVLPPRSHRACYLLPVHLYKTLYNNQASFDSAKDGGSRENAT